MDTAEDARLFKKCDQFWITFNAASHDRSQPRAMYIAALDGDIENGNVSAKPIKLAFENHLTQKNWVPFVKDGTIYFEYSLSPHKVLKFDEKAKALEVVSEANKGSKWGYGELRGGTPASLWGDEWLGFFHSSFAANGLLWYVFGAYSYAAGLPHQITRISKSPIEFREMYSAPIRPGLEGKRVIFPSGYVMRGDIIYLSCGENDSRIKILAMNAERLRGTLVPTEEVDVVPETPCDFRQSFNGTHVLGCNVTQVQGFNSTHLGRKMTNATNYSSMHGCNYNATRVGNTTRH
jgi:predicted GH43/DUF377 family glycosyl hydrolase